MYRRSCAWGGIQKEEFSSERKISGGWIFQGIWYIGGDLTELLYDILFKLSYILFAKFYVWISSLGIIRGLFSAYFDFREIISTEGGISGVIGKLIKH